MKGAVIDCRKWSSTKAILVGRHFEICNKSNRWGDGSLSSIGQIINLCFVERIRMLVHYFCTIKINILICLIEIVFHKSYRVIVQMQF